MKRKRVSIMGRVLMIAGFMAMLMGIAGAVVVQGHIAELFANTATYSLALIFFGALVWLIGANTSGRDIITDRYWWAKHFDKRCHHAHHHHHS